MNQQVETCVCGLSFARNLSFALLFLLAVSGCERVTPRVYDIPDAIDQSPVFSPAPLDNGAGVTASFPVTQQVDLKWVAPKSWVEAPVGPMRLAVYSAESGSIELSVSRFPGEVGGDLANINRWRRQLGLSPLVNLSAVDGLRVEVNTVASGQLIELFSSEGNGMLVHWFNFKGHTWFFKASGSREALLSVRDQFDLWIQSITEVAQGE